jgi:hypothetical protein
MDTASVGAGGEGPVVSVVLSCHYDMICKRGVGDSQSMSVGKRMKLLAQSFLS